MRDLITTENITLDGVIDAAGGWFAPRGEDGVDQSDMLAALTDQREAADAFLVGRTTFEQMRRYWPRLTDGPTGIGDYLNRVSKYVVSTTLEDPGWDRTTVLRGPLREDIGALKTAPGADIVVTGSVTHVRGLIAAGLDDEYRLFVHPVVLGRGARLFADGAAPPRLRLAETRPFRCGVVLLRTAPAERVAGAGSRARAGCEPPQRGGRKPYRRLAAAVGSWRRVARNHGGFGAAEAKRAFDRAVRARRRASACATSARRDHRQPRAQRGGLVRPRVPPVAADARPLAARVARRAAGHGACRPISVARVGDAKKISVSPPGRRSPPRQLLHQPVDVGL